MGKFESVEGDSEYAPESAVLLLFASRTNSAIDQPGPVGGLLARWSKAYHQCYLHSQIGSLRELFNERVDSSTMRAQGKFEKYS
jgi:hypothetical protein